MKRLVCAVMATLTVATFLVGCSKETECEGCQKVKECNEYEVEGKDVWLCDDCHALVKALENLANQ